MGKDLICASTALKGTMSSKDRYQQLLELCKKWDFPLGPFLTPEDVRAEMSRFSRELGPEEAERLASFVKQQKTLGLGSHPMLTTILETAVDDLASPAPLVVDRVLLDRTREAGNTPRAIKIAVPWAVDLT